MTYRKFHQISLSSNLSKQKYENVQYPESTNQNDFNGNYFVTSVHLNMKDQIEMVDFQTLFLNMESHKITPNLAGICKKAFLRIDDPNYHKSNNCPLNKPSFRAGKKSISSITSKK